MNKLFFTKGIIFIFLFIQIFPSYADPKPIPLEDTTGPQKTAVLLANFYDKIDRTVTPSEAHELVFVNISAYFYETSYEKTWLVGDVFSWYDLDISYTTCDIGETIRKSIEAAISKDDVNFMNYGRILIFIPGLCNGASYSNIGKDEYTLPNGTKINISTSEIGVQKHPGTRFESVVLHELGHAYGLLHAGGLYCKGFSVGDVGPDECINYEGADPSDIMSLAASSTPHTNAYHKERLHWFEPTNVVTSKNGIYEIEPFETKTSGIKTVKVPISDTGRYYYLEYRQPIGFDEKFEGFYDSVNFHEGLLIHLAFYLQAQHGGGTDTGLVDVHYPTTLNSTDPKDLFHFGDSALLVGETFEDNMYGINITVLSRDENSIKVEIKSKSDLMEGDTNLNKHVTIVDALLIAKYKVGSIVLTPDQLKSADTNDDGSVTIIDALYIAKWLANSAFGIWDLIKDADMLKPVP